MVWCNVPPREFSVKARRPLLSPSQPRRVLKKGPDTFSSFFLKDYKPILYPAPFISANASFLYFRKTSHFIVWEVCWNLLSVVGILS